jgi:predicted nucleotidyltransferase component of viral defense system
VGKGKTAALKDAELKRLEEIKKLVIVAMFSDDELMERLVLKGGNALDLIHEMSTRASVDVDFSMEDDFPAKQCGEYLGRVEHALRSTFKLKGYEIFDVRMQEQPRGITPDMAGFWGGYSVEFKIIEKEKYQRFSNVLEELRKNAVQLGNSTKFFIDISRFEYTTGKERHELNGHQIFVYSPAMILCEKVRAICQQMPEYDPVVKRTRQDAGRARARDFLDIHTLITKYDLELTSDENLSLLRNVFDAKRVPLELLKRIQSYRETHRQDFLDVESTLKAGVKVQSFDFYFDFVLTVTREVVGKLHKPEEQA